MQKTLFLACAVTGLHATMAGNGLDFMSIGDWGDTGAIETAKGMGDYSVDWILSTGDNFYLKGVTGVHDEQFKDKFEDTFTAANTQVPWYLCAGNHDYYGGDVSINAEMQYSNTSSRWNFPSLYYDFVKQGTDGATAHFLSIDTWRLNGGDTYVAYDSTTNKAALRNRTHMEAKVAEGDMDPRTFSQLLDNIDQQHPDPAREVVSTPDQEQYDWIAKTLAASTADWKIVFGHFPIRSATTGEHGDTPALVASLLPILEKYGVSAYFNGHDHVLQHISSDSVHFFGTGAGAKTQAEMNTNYTGLKGYLAGSMGFMVHGISKSVFSTSFADPTGKITYSYNITK